MNAERAHLPGLDALRGIAAIAVVLLHSGYDFHTEPLVSRGYLAVDFFFMLSGFVLAHAYSERLRTGLEGDVLIKARLRRLYPMVLLGIITGAAASAFAGTPGHRILATALTGGGLVPTLDGDPADGLFPIDPPLWSLFWEMIAGVALARGLWRLSSRRLFCIQVALLAALAMVAWCYGTMEIGFQRDTFLAGALRAGFGFVTGLLLHRWWKRQSGARSRMSVIWPAIAFVIALCFPAPVPRPIYDLAVIATVFPVLIVLTANVRSVGKVWQIGALVSYPLYLIHAPVLRAVQSWHRDHPSINAGDCVVIGLALSLIAAWLAYRLWDAPAQEWLRGRASSRPQVGFPPQHEAAARHNVGGEVARQR